eukprot:TRINITY_DN2296_c3_g2_i1.p1 TRINITY_DN2296_c3_g2~~TRINITY_DN2296_c3_g2_i1.p1  ORF type:complete len:380 (+),score=131.00 TRINITY_DN2296_c3_g2_i1:38-1177(+)
MSTSTPAQAQAQASYNDGNTSFVDEQYEEALAHYNTAIAADGTKCDFFIKRSACHVKLGNHTDALADANKAIEHDATSSKAYFRKGVACFELDEFESAQAAFKKGTALDPKNKLFATWLRKCAAELDDEENDDEDDDDVPAPAPAAAAVVAAAAAPAAAAAAAIPAAAAVPAPAPVVEVPVKAPPLYRHEWYQSDSYVTISLFAKGIKKEALTVNITDNNVCVDIALPEDGKTFTLDLDMCDMIVPAESKFELMSTKIEIKLKKKNVGSWSTLGPQGNVRGWDDTSSVNKSAYPSSAKKKVDWDAVSKEAEEEKLEGEQALNKVFQDIYGNGNDEQRKAMVKSFTESGGTVLSTNWDDVGKKKVECTPPKGLEEHKWGE